ncbi:CFF_collapsed_G0035160.mRNA.1.CDS.1 [Saccharomyces cerevisiae]|nr:CFF_collapsed_G0035160.mRNA.1.CDS.1 [Saccharomyces cerevisiae]
MSDHDTPTESIQNGENSDERLNAIASFFGCSLEQVKSFDGDVVKHLNDKLLQFNELKSENLKVTVSFDELKASSLKKIDGLKTEMENVIRENDKIRKERNDTFVKFESVENEKMKLSSELEFVKRKLDDLTEEKKETQSNQQRTLKILDERLKEIELVRVENNRSNSECKKLRSTIMDLETKQQGYITNDLNSRTELERKTQELTLLQSNNDWLEKELRSKNEQYLSYRQKTDKVILDIRNELNRLRNDFQMERTNNDVLKQKNNELSKSLQEKLLEIKGLSDSLNSEKQEFSAEMSLKQRLVDLLESQLNAVKEELNSIRELNTAKVIADDSKKQTSENEDLLKELQLTKEKLAQCEKECLRLSSITDEADEDNENLSAKSSSDFILLKKQLIKERRTKEHLQNQIETFIVELEHKVPIINSFKERTDMLENELNNAALLLEHTSNEKNAKVKELNAKNQKLVECENDLQTLTKQRLDLCRQIQYLLITNSVSNDSKGPLRKEEIQFIQNIMQEDDSTITESDSQKVVTERLVEFKNIIQLQEKNAELLKVVRNLADKLESKEKKSKQSLQKIESETVNEAKEAIITLKSEKMELESRIEELQKELEELKTSVPNEDADAKNVLENSLSEANARIEELQNAKVAQGNNQLEAIRKLQEDAEKASRELQAKLEESTTSYESTINGLNEEITTLKEEIEKQRQIQQQLQATSANEQNDLSNIVESMKKSFEEDKIKFIKEKTQEVNEKILEAQERLNQPSNINMEEIKKKWESEHEQEVSQKIREAEEALKKRIRLPTEEKINKIIERKKEELEKEFEEKVEERIKSMEQSGEIDVVLRKQLEAKVQEKQKELENEYNKKLQEELKDVPHSSHISDDERDKLRAEIESRLREEFNNELQAIKKKSFDEGKQQAMMKTTLLERKLAKMESQLSETKQSAESPPKSVNNVQNPLLGLPRKIEENSNSPFNPLLSGEKLLKLNSKSSSGGFNPFTSPSPNKHLQNDNDKRESLANKTDPPTHLEPSFNIPASRGLISSSSTLSTDTNDEELTSNEPAQKDLSNRNVQSEEDTEKKKEGEPVKRGEAIEEQTKSNKRPIDEVGELKNDEDDTTENINESKKIKTEDEEEKETDKVNDENSI